MNGFLQRILETKAVEVEALRPRGLELESLAAKMAPCRGFAAAISNCPGLAVVAEVKKASPSKGVIQTAFYPAAIARTYGAAGANAVSVLTDRSYFQGSLADLEAVHRAVIAPVLRKDFIIDELQLLQARTAGADAVLLICAALAPARLRRLSDYAARIGLDVLIEVHGAHELDSALAANPSVIGINNRNLHTFEVSLSTSEALLPEIPPSLPKLAESGIRTGDDAVRMARAGADGILVGESLMRLSRPTDIMNTIQTFQNCGRETGTKGVM